MGFYPCRLFMWNFWSPYNLSVRLPSYSILPGNITRIVHKDFSLSQISSSTSIRSTTAEPNKCTEHGAIQKGSLQCTVGAVSISCLLCTSIYSRNCDHSYLKKYSLLLVFAWKGAVILLSFNSTLNPFLYCWKISEVRKAVKQTLKEALCWNRSAFNGSSDPQSRLIKSWLLLESSRQISYWIKTNKWLNGIVAQAVVDSLYISENNLTTD